MKKLDTTIQIKFKMPSLYKEDLEEIESAIAAIQNHAELKIRTGNFEYDRVSEIATEDRSGNEMLISSSKPYIRLSLNKRSAEIYASGEDAIQITGITNLLANIIKKRERKIRWVNSQLAILYPSVLMIALMNAFGPIKTKWIDQLTHWQLNTVLVFTFLLLVFGFRDAFFSYSSVSFNLRSKKTNWLTRNKDQILLGLFNTIASGVVGYLIGTSK